VPSVFGASICGENLEPMNADLSLSKTAYCPVLRCAAGRELELKGWRLFIFAHFVSRQAFSIKKHVSVTALIRRASPGLEGLVS